MEKGLLGFCSLMNANISSIPCPKKNKELDHRDCLMEQRVLDRNREIFQLASPSRAKEQEIRDQRI
jgi:hypothetical protein